MSFETEKESYVSPFIRNFSLYSSGMQLLLLAAFDKNLNILSLFDFHHIFFELSVLLQTSQPNRGFENFTVCFRQYLRISGGIFFPTHTIQLKYHFHIYPK